jgi:hypothetical protein
VTEKLYSDKKISGIMSDPERFQTFPKRLLHGRAPPAPSQQENVVLWIGWPAEPANP